MNENVTISTMYNFIRQLVAIYREHIQTTDFDATFHVDGVKVHVRMSDVEKKQQDEDDRRVD